MSDRYVKVTALLMDNRNRAIEITKYTTDGEPRERVWIPRSLIHGADDLRLDSHRTGDLINFRLMAWKAKDLDL